MSLTRWWFPVALAAIAVAACACPTKQPAGTGGGTASDGCEAVRGKVLALYRGESTEPDAARAAELVADNTTMVMNDCVRAPGQVTACITRATTVAELERACLVPLDEEGTEGEALRK